MESNALINETSPYLLQHARNPVQWYPWGDEALERARREDKPILLSIGYSACHWCHVMAHESFEDQATAQVMNEHFVNIKVDREERPDIDKIYQTAQQLLTRRSGGWPLTMFLTPRDHVPFFGGTYFPPEPRHGLPGFRDLLLQVSRFYHSERDAIERQNSSMLEALHQLARPRDGGQEPDAAPLHAAVEELESIFDPRHGGFGGAPKFPHPSNLEFLLHYRADPALRPDDERPMQMVLTTLRRMAEGGIHDHLGGGFCRYSVDERWMIPHFEKMLYDNGPLLGLYADAWHVTRDPFYRQVAEGIAGWVMREMQSPEGGYYSSLDADSEGEEGRFYLWTPAQLRTLLDEPEFRVVSLRFGLDGPANFEGHWHLYGARSVEDVAAAAALDTGEVQRLLDSARGKLLPAREQRVRPGRDDKVLTSWNALMIRGMARAAFRLGRDDLYESAAGAMRFLRSTLWHDGRLLATWKDGRAHLRAYLDDYALLMDAALALLQCRWSGELLAFASELAEVLLGDFADKEQGGFYFTSADHERLIQRRKDFADDAVPSGNGTAALALLRLGHFSGDERLVAAAQATVRAGMGQVAGLPHAHGSMLIALAELLNPPPLVVLRGDPEGTTAWRRHCAATLDLRARWYEIPTGAGALPALLQERRHREGSAVTAWLCEGFTCREPVTEAAALADSLNAVKGG